jgi:hypothetical protein
VEAILSQQFAQLEGGDNNAEGNGGGNVSLIYEPPT